MSRLFTTITANSRTRRRGNCICNIMRLWERWLCKKKWRIKRSERGGELRRWDGRKGRRGRRVGGILLWIDLVVFRGRVGKEAKRKRRVEQGSLPLEVVFTIRLKSNVKKVQKIVYIFLWIEVQMSKKICSKYTTTPKVAATCLFSTKQVS